MTEGQTVTPKYEFKKEYTKAPNLISEGELLSQMDQHHLGTPATRAEIIEKLIKSELMERQGRQLHVTP
jgi:Topoisomerase IA